MEATVSQHLINEYVAAIEQHVERDRFLAAVERLQGLTSLEEESQPLAGFLTDYSKSVAEVFAATSVAIWFRESEEGGLQRRVDVGWENLRLDTQVASGHAHLVAHALDSPRPLAVHPFAAPEAGAPANPTDSFLLFAPVMYAERRVAVVEIALGPKPLRRPHHRLVEAYLPWLDWLVAVLEHGMRVCFQSEQPLFLALQCLQSTSDEVQQLQAQIVSTIQSSLQQLAGQKFGSLAANQRLAKEVHALLDSKGLRVKCPECGAAAILRCQNSGNAKTGAFVYDHYLETGRTFHGGPSTFPLLELVPKPPRRRS